ncbi:Ribosomal RNA methyltransferase FtsJ domain,S-adenosyl-L-methionine-dependent methyltransferase [Cinara cedri]|uniref:rRNA methyltransferase 2, mitochondrial n=1 Tax=Cinara cedri TaxID=506608 RepID=A0A5E4MU86_9HEMI|nr:Ribosomal RNA methyltransferase FtsJ domain,S-adenosyl-L-methionine-dependent methyltransferase [Cinara cedri]
MRKIIKVYKNWLIIKNIIREQSSKEWLLRQKTDIYVEKAKLNNYRCRSAFKLLQIDDRFTILKPGQCVIDIGAAPGSWSQVAASRINSDSASKAVLEQNPRRKRPLGRPKTRWEDVVKKDVQSLGGGMNWKERAMDREEWRNGCEMGWS